jgi:hypothetical protein
MSSQGEVIDLLLVIFDQLLEGALLAPAKPVDELFPFGHHITPVSNSLDEPSRPKVGKKGVDRGASLCPGSYL